MFKRFMAGVAAVGLAFSVAPSSSASHIVEVEIDEIGSWDQTDRSVTITGTVTCNDGIDDNVAVFVDIVQGNNKNKPRAASGYAGSFGPCNDPETVHEWSITLSSSTEFPFQPGNVTHVFAETDCCTETGPLYATDEADVLVQAAGAGL